MTSSDDPVLHPLLRDRRSVQAYDSSHVLHGDVLAALLLAPRTRRPLAEIAYGARFGR